MSVKAWMEKINIPTYRIGEPDKNPMFLENRVYQGSSGVVYPHPVIDKVFDEKADKEWLALFLENEYLKIMVLPELGGRIQMAYDKTNNYHFVYYNSVIKPALVGLAGPWISGGIEFNWPQHHRPSTFDPIDYCIKENEDGSKTIWVNEYEKMFRTKCALGFTLHSGKAYIELQAKLYNKTPFPQTFLWWANPAVSVDEHYQSVFPPDVHAVFDHGKRDVSSFPIATGIYYKVDYSPGKDISRYNNIPVPTSYMAVNSAFNFLGGYHHQKKAGLMHIADHHVSPGKKQWTWGCGEFGKAWNRQLTDEDGPYFELMCGIYTDNQPDFSWIMPNETREFTQYYMPYKNIGYVKNASVDAMLNLEVHNDEVQMDVYVTQQRHVIIELWYREEKIHSHEEELSPTKTYSKKLQLGSDIVPEALRMMVCDKPGCELISYTPVRKKEDAIPDPAKPIPDPALLPSAESCYIAGLHLEQYRHATFQAVDYYREGLKRDEGDIRNNNAMGLWLLRRGKFAESEIYFIKAIERLQKHNPNPYDSEPLYNLGLALKYRGRLEESYNYFFKATWNADWQDNAYLQLPYISVGSGQWKAALEFVDKSLFRNLKSIKARQLKASVLRKINNPKQAVQFAQESIGLDNFDFGSRFEKYLSQICLEDQQGAAITKSGLIQLMRDEPHTYIELSIDYSNAAQWDEAISLLQWIADTTTYPLVHYYLAYYYLLTGNAVKSKEYAAKGFEQSPDRVFPNRLEDILVLQCIIQQNPGDYKAAYYLGNLFYDKRQYDDARVCWEKSVSIFDGFATVHRNLGLAYFNKFNRKEDAIGCFEKAFYLDTNDARILLELDQLYKKINREPQQRLNFLTQYEQLVRERDDLYIEYVTLHSLSGQEEKAMQLLMSRNFHPWEGGEGKVSGQYVHLLIALAKKSIQQNRLSEAIQLLQQAKEYPDNLGEGKLYGALENDIDYWLGYAFEKAGEIKAATDCWQQGAKGLPEPSAAMFYNDQQPDKIFYQGLSLLKLQRQEEARERFQTLVAYGDRNRNNEMKLDFFAVSLPDLMIFDDDLKQRNIIHCDYIMGLGWLGLGELEKTRKHFHDVLEADPSHLGVRTHMPMLLVIPAEHSKLP